MSIQLQDENLRQSIIDSNYDFDVIEEASERVKNRIIFLFGLLDEYRGTEHEKIVNKQLDDALRLSQYISDCVLVSSFKKRRGVVAYA